jgi:hypothetical protein
MHLSSQADLPAGEILRDLLAALPLWQDKRERQAFLEFALQGHPAIADLEHDGKPMTPACELVTRLHRHAYRSGEDGRHPVCVLLREIRTRRQDANPAVAERLAPLARFFGCDAPPPAQLPGSPYPGLQAYDWGQDPALARLCFGRDPETLEFIQRLRAQDGGEEDRVAFLELLLTGVGPPRFRVIATFLVLDDPGELQALIQRVYGRQGGDADPAARVHLLRCLTAPGRSWATTAALGRWVAGQGPAGCGRGWPGCSPSSGRTRPSLGTAAASASATSWRPWGMIGQG